MSADLTPQSNDPTGDCTATKKKGLKKKLMKLFSKSEGNLKQKTTTDGDTFSEEYEARTPTIGGELDRKGRSSWSEKRGKKDRNGAQNERQDWTHSLPRFRHHRSEDPVLRKTSRSSKTRSLSYSEMDLPASGFLQRIGSLTWRKKRFSAMEYSDMASPESTHMDTHWSLGQLDRSAVSSEMDLGNESLKSCLLESPCTSPLNQSSDCCLNNDQENQWGLKVASFNCLADDVISECFKTGFTEGTDVHLQYSETSNEMQQVGENASFPKWAESILNEYLPMHHQPLDSLLLSEYECSPVLEVLEEGEEPLKCYKSDLAQKPLQQETAQKQSHVKPTVFLQEDDTYIQDPKTYNIITGIQKQPPKNQIHLNPSILALEVLKNEPPQKQISTYSSTLTHDEVLMGKPQNLKSQHLQNPHQEDVHKNNLKCPMRTTSLTLNGVLHISQQPCSLNPHEPSKDAVQMEDTSIQRSLNPKDPFQDGVQETPQMYIPLCSSILGQEIGQKVSESHLTSPKIKKDNSKTLTSPSTPKVRYQIIVTLTKKEKEEVEAKVPGLGGDLVREEELAGPDLELSPSLECQACGHHGMGPAVVSALTHPEQTKKYTRQEEEEIPKLKRGGNTCVEAHLDSSLDLAVGEEWPLQIADQTSKNCKLDSSMMEKDGNLKRDRSRSPWRAQPPKMVGIINSYEASKVSSDRDRCSTTEPVRTMSPGLILPQPYVKNVTGLRRVFEDISSKEDVTPHSGRLTSKPFTSLRENKCSVTKNPPVNPGIHSPVYSQVFHPLKTHSVERKGDHSSEAVINNSSKSITQSWENKKESVNSRSITDTTEINSMDSSCKEKQTTHRKTRSSIKDLNLPSRTPTPPLERARDVSISLRSPKGWKNESTMVQSPRSLCTKFIKNLMESESSVPVQNSETFIFPSMNDGLGNNVIDSGLSHRTENGNVKTYIGSTEEISSGTSITNTPEVSKEQIEYPYIITHLQEGNHHEERTNRIFSEGNIECKRGSVLPFQLKDEQLTDEIPVDSGQLKDMKSKPTDPKFTEKQVTLAKENEGLVLLADQKNCKEDIAKLNQNERHQDEDTTIILTHRGEKYQYCSDFQFFSTVGKTHQGEMEDIIDSCEHIVVSDTEGLMHNGKLEDDINKRQEKFHTENIMNNVYQNASVAVQKDFLNDIIPIIAPSVVECAQDHHGDILYKTNVNKDESSEISAEKSESNSMEGTMPDQVFSADQTCEIRFLKPTDPKFTEKQVTLDKENEGLVSLADQKNCKEDIAKLNQNETHQDEDTTIILTHREEKYQYCRDFQFFSTVGKTHQGEMEDVIDSCEHVVVSDTEGLMHNGKLEDDINKRQEKFHTENIMNNVYQNASVAVQKDFLNDTIPIIAPSIVECAQDHHGDILYKTNVNKDESSEISAEKSESNSMEGTMPEQVFSADQTCEIRLLKLKLSKYSDLEGTYSAPQSTSIIREAKMSTLPVQIPIADLKALTDLETNVSSHSECQGETVKGHVDQVRTLEINVIGQVDDVVGKSVDGWNQTETLIVNVSVKQEPTENTTYESPEDMITEQSGHAVDFTGSMNRLAEPVENYSEQSAIDVTRRSKDLMGQVKDSVFFKSRKEKTEGYASDQLAGNINPEKAEYVVNTWGEDLIWVNSVNMIKEHSEDEIVSPDGELTSSQDEDEIISFPRRGKLVDNNSDLSDSDEMEEMANQGGDVIIFAYTREVLTETGSIHQNEDLVQQTTDEIGKAVDEIDFMYETENVSHMQLEYGLDQAIDETNEVENTVDFISIKESAESINNKVSGIMTEQPVDGIKQAVDVIMFPPSHEENAEDWSNNQGAITVQFNQLQNCRNSSLTNKNDMQESAEKRGCLQTETHRPINTDSCPLAMDNLKSDVDKITSATSSTAFQEGTGMVCINPPGEEAGMVFINSPGEKASSEALYEGPSRISHLDSNARISLGYMTDPQIVPPDKGKWAMQSLHPVQYTQVSSKDEDMTDGVTGEYASHCSVKKEKESTEDMEIWVNNLRQLETPDIMKHPRIPRQPRTSRLSIYATLPPIKEDISSPKSDFPNSLRCSEEENDDLENSKLCSKSPETKTELTLEQPGKKYSWERNIDKPLDKSSPMEMMRKHSGVEVSKSTAYKALITQRQGSIIGSLLLSDRLDKTTEKSQGKSYSRLDSSLLLSSYIKPQKKTLLRKEGEVQTLSSMVTDTHESSQIMPKNALNNEKSQVTDTPSVPQLEDGVGSGLITVSRNLPSKPNIPVSSQVKAFPDIWLHTEKEHGKLNPRPGKIVLFSDAEFKGQCYEIYGNVGNTSDWELQESISVRVIRGGWLLYEKPRFCGRRLMLLEGDTELTCPWKDLKRTDEEQPGIQSKTKCWIGSVRHIVSDFQVPKISLFQEENGEGEKVTFVGVAPDIRASGQPIKTESIIVYSGLWMVYSKPLLEGDPYILEPGGYPNRKAWGGEDPCVCSLEPACIGGPTVERPNEPKLLLFQFPDFEGHCWEVTRDLQSVQGEPNSQGQLLFSVGSLKVLGGCWVGYEKEGFRGHQYLLEEGDFKNFSYWGGCTGELGSLRLIRTDFSEPQIVLYEGTSCSEGLCLRLSEALSDLELAEYGTNTRSIHVLSGVWIAYENVDFSGEQYILEKGTYHNYQDWGADNCRICSVQPVIQVGGQNLHFVSKIHLFSEPNFHGDCLTCAEDNMLLPESFSPQSCRVEGGSWSLYEGKNCSGEQYILSEGDYPTRTAMGCLTFCVLQSLRKVPLYFSVPSISLHGLERFEGKELEFSGEVRSLQGEGYNNHVMSVRVSSGIWVVYEHSDFRGRQWLLEHTQIPNWLLYSGLQRIGSLCPIRQKRVYFRLRNRELGLFLSVPEPSEDMKAARVLVTEPREGSCELWYYEEGRIKNQLNPFMSLQVIGQSSPGTKVILWSEGRKPIQKWNLEDSGHILSNIFQGMCLDIKGGHSFDSDHVVIWEAVEDRLSQRWDLEVF